MNDNNRYRGRSDAAGGGFKKLEAPDRCGVFQIVILADLTHGPVPLNGYGRIAASRRTRDELIGGRPM